MDHTKIPFVNSAAQQQRGGHLSGDDVMRVVECVDDVDGGRQHAHRSHQQQNLECVDTEARPNVVSVVVFERNQRSANSNHNRVK